MLHKPCSHFQSQTANDMKHPAAHVERNGYMFVTVGIRMQGLFQATFLSHWYTAV